MNKNLLLITLTLILVAGCAKSPETIDTNNLSENPDTQEVEQQTEQETETTEELTSKIEPIDDFWSKYTNYQLGFEINFPTQQEGQDVQIVESGEVVYILNPTYSNDNFTQQKDLTSPFDQVRGIAFAINIQDANNDQELDTFIKNTYGSDCKLGEKITTTIPNLFNLNVDSSAWNPALDLEGDCFLNYGFELKYSDTKNKVAAWDIGQDMTFGPWVVSDDVTMASIDQQISESFRFL